MPSSGSCLLSPGGGHKVTTLPPLKRKHYGRRFQKWLNPNSAAAVVFDSLFTIPDLLSAGLAGSIEPMTIADFWVLLVLLLQAHPVGT